MIALHSFLWFKNKDHTFYPTLAKLILGSSEANIVQDITNKFNSSKQSIDCSNNKYYLFQQTCLGSINSNATILDNVDSFQTLIWDIYHKSLIILHWNNITKFNITDSDPHIYIEENTIVMYYDTNFDFFGPIIRK